MNTPPAEPRKANRGPQAAAANRRALIAAARVVFGGGGYNAPLSSVAKLAGVGQGSLYRHFPDRLSLAVAVFDENIGELEAIAERPDGTLDQLFDVIVEQALASSTMIDMIDAAPGDERVRHLDKRVEELVSRLLQRERAAGRLGRSLDVEDVMLSISMLAGVVARTSAERRSAVACRARALIQTAFVHEAT